MVSQEDELVLSFRALADPTRQKIVGLLAEGQLSVQEIADRFPMTRPGISKHLKMLREGGLVVEKRAGRERIYALDRRRFSAAQAWLAGFNGGRRSGSAARGSPPAARQSRGGGAGRILAAPTGSSADWRVW